MVLETPPKDYSAAAVQAGAIAAEIETKGTNAMETDTTDGVFGADLPVPKTHAAPSAPIPITSGMYGESALPSFTKSYNPTRTRS